MKNFNDKVVSEVRKDEFKRLMEEGKEEEACMLKRSRHILTSRRETLARKDAEAAERARGWLGSSRRSERRTSEPVAEFDERLWGCMVDYVTVCVDGDMTVAFRDGTRM